MSEDILDKILEVTVGLLVFGAVAPAIGTGLNATIAAFTAFTGATSLLNILPVLLIVGVLYAMVKFGKTRGYI